MKVIVGFLFSALIASNALGSTVCLGTPENEFTLQIEITDSAVIVKTGPVGGVLNERRDYQLSSTRLDDGRPRVIGRVLTSPIAHAWDLVTVKIDGANSTFNFGRMSGFSATEWGKAGKISCR